MRVRKVNWKVVGVRMPLATSEGGREAGSSGLDVEPRAGQPVDECFADGLVVFDYEHARHRRSRYRCRARSRLMHADFSVS